MADPNDPFDPVAATARFNTLADSDGEASPMVAKLQETAKASPDTSWWSRLPKNIGAGLYKAALNTIETGADVVDTISEGTDSAVKKIADTPDIPKPIPVREMFPDFFNAANEFGASLSKDNTLSDDIVQGIAQFAIPFAAYARAIGGFKAGQTAMNVGKAVAAEAATAATAFSAHEGRFADLVQMGRESEGKFGELLRKLSPDGSLTNNYINWMTSREDEGEWEGRFKNAVDSVATTGVVGAVLKGAAVGFRAAKQIAADPIKVGPKAQRGAAVDALENN
jgi:hypothetical protein